MCWNWIFLNGLAYFALRKHKRSPKNCIGETAYSAKKLGITNLDETKLLAKAINAPKVNPFELAPTHSLTMSNREFTALKDAMQKDGMLRDTFKTVTHNSQKYIVDRHHRARAAKELGWTEVPVVEVTLPFLGYKTIGHLFN